MKNCSHENAIECFNIKYEHSINMNLSLVFYFELSMFKILIKIYYKVCSFKLYTQQYIETEKLTFRILVSLFSWPKINLKYLNSTRYLAYY